MFERNSVAPQLRLGGRADLALNLFEIGKRTFSEGQNYWRKNFAYTVVVSERDSLYPEVHDWLIDTLPSEKHRSLAISSPKSSRDSNVSPEDGTSSAEYMPKPLTVRFNAKTERKLSIEGHPVSVSISMPEAPERLGREPEPTSIEFVARSHAGQKAIIRQLEALNAKRATSRKAVLNMVNQWGSWSTRSDLPPRTMASVALPTDQKARIVSDLKRFLDSESRYNDLAIPWHRGYMLYGPPGTGKTSLVKALANEFNLDMWYVSLSDLDKESSLLGLLSSVGPRSILLLEDIDTMRITHDRDGSDQGKISMSSLLNTLDGVATPHGLITVMTTNRFEILDPALTRPGRMDLIEELSWPTVSTLAAMYEHFFKVTPAWANSGDIHAPLESLSTGQISEVMKRYMDEPMAASVAIVEILHAMKVA